MDFSVAHGDWRRSGPGLERCNGFVAVDDHGFFAESYFNFSIIL